MKKKNKITMMLAVAFISMATFSVQLHAQSNQPKIKKWGIETDLVQPFIPEVNIITLKATVTVIGNPAGKHGDFMFGTFIRPYISHDVVTKIEEYMGSIGFRYYFNRAFNAELQYYAGHVFGEKNKVDGKDYKGFVHFLESNIGYKFEFGKTKRTGWYIMPQFGYLMGMNKELIIGPRNGKEDNFVQGKLQVGISF